MTRPAAGGRTEAKARVSDLPLLEDLHAHLPVGLLVTDAETLELLYARPPLPGFGDADGPPEQLLESRREGGDPRTAAPELAGLVEEAAATGKPQHLSEFSAELRGREPRWWSATAHRIDTDRRGRVVVTLAVELTDQVRARQLLAERERRRQALQQAIAAVPGQSLASSLQQVAGALVPALQVDVVALRLLGADAKLHLVAASGLRPAERRRLALEPIAARRLETLIAGSRHPLVGSGDLQWVEIRWLEANDERIGTLTVGARRERREPDDDLALLDDVTAQLSNALEKTERSTGFLRRRSLELGRLGVEDDQLTKSDATGLRPRELTILRLYGEGLATDQIAQLLVLSPHTVRTHVRNARRRLGVTSRADALALLEGATAGPVI